MSDDRDDEFSWQCSRSHWNKRDDERCGRCGEPKFEQAEMLRELLEKVSREHKRDESE